MLNMEKLKGLPTANMARREQRLVLSLKQGHRHGIMPNYCERSANVVVSAKANWQALSERAEPISQL